MCWVSPGVRIFLQKSAVFWISFQCIITSFTYAMYVNVNITHHKMADRAVPEELNITLITDAGTQSHLYLKRVDHVSPNVPVYTHNIDADGNHVHKRERMQDKQNVGYYQDINNDAVIQVTRTNAQEEKEVHLVLKGELNIAGSKYILTLGTRRKRDGGKEAQPQSFEAYNLFPQSSADFLQYDYIEAPPEIKLGVVESTQLERPYLSTERPSLHMPWPTKPALPPPASSKRRRRQSHTTENYYIDVVALADYATYRRFLTSSETRTDTLQAMREYYAFIFTGVDLRYQSITSTNYVIHVRLIKVIITETAAASTFTEKFRVTSRPWDEVDAQRVLSAFSDFVTSAGSDMVNPCDHAMLFTGFGNKTTEDIIRWLAFTSTLCRTDGKSVSVVEDLGGFQAVDTAAHELGHSLSARHDGDGNTCRSADRYIMASGSRRVTSSNRFNPWLFSACSVASFSDFVSRTLRTTRGQTCLLSSLPVDIGLPDVSSRLPGQEFPPDDQCRMIYGSASRLCRGTEFGTSSSVCTSMFCFDPGTTGTCYEMTAAMGTTCGNGKLCLNGQCVYDPRAPAVEDDCVFGDQPGSAFDEMVCPDFVNNFIGYCYQAVVRGRCCASCKRAYRTVTDCEYGDKVRGCAANVCGFASISYREQCCGTCNHGAHFILPPSTPVTFKATNNARYTSERQATTPATISTNIVHTDPGVCEDNPMISITGQTCADAVAGSPRLCYRTDVIAACCSSCDEVSTGVAGCEYGDKDPSTCGQSQACDSAATGCCRTCSQKAGTSNGSVTGPSISASASSCTDQHNYRINNLTCAEAIRQSPFYCYTDKVLETCCFSCRQKYSGIKGCEYGDRTPQICQSVSRRYECRSLAQNCCSTCFSHAYRPAINLLVPLVIVVFTHFLISVLSAKSTLFLRC